MQIRTVERNENGDVVEAEGTPEESMSIAKFDNSVNDHLAPHFKKTTKDDIQLELERKYWDEVQTRPHSSLRAQGRAHTAMRNEYGDYEDDNMYMLGDYENFDNYLYDAAAENIMKAQDEFEAAKQLLRRGPLRKKYSST